MGKILNYKILGTALKSLSDACFKADEQQRNGDKVTACGMGVGSLLYKHLEERLKRMGIENLLAGVAYYALGQYLDAEKAAK